MTKIGQQIWYDISEIIYIFINLVFQLNVVLQFDTLSLAKAVFRSLKLPRMFIFHFIISRGILPNAHENLFIKLNWKVYVLTVFASSELWTQRRLWATRSMIMNFNSVPLHFMSDSVVTQQWPSSDPACSDGHSSLFCNWFNETIDIPLRWMKNYNNFLSHSSNRCYIINVQWWHMCSGDIRAVVIYV